MTDTPNRSSLIIPVHPSEVIREEMEAREWDIDMLAMRMGPEFDVNRCALDLYFEVGPTEPGLLMGEVTSKALGRAFGVSPDLFLNPHKNWKEAYVAAAH